MCVVIQNIAEAGCDYVERARHRMPMLNHAIETLEPYLIPVTQVAEIYLDAALGLCQERPPDKCDLGRETMPNRAAVPVGCKLQRVGNSFDLVQLRYQSPQERGLLHRACQTGTKLLTRLEAFGDTLGPSGCDDDLGFGQLKCCDSDSGYTASFHSSYEDDSSVASELCLTAAEIIPRAIILPVVLQYQVARFAVDRASSLTLTAAAMSYSLLQNGAIYCARRTLQGACRFASRIALCRQVACLVDSLLGSAPRVRQAIVLALTDDESVDHIKESGVGPCDAGLHNLSNANTDGGTGCCSR